MTLQEFIDFTGYVRCFTFGKNDITPVRYDPKERRYLIEHEYLPKISAPASSKTRKPSIKPSATK